MRSYGLTGLANLLGMSHPTSINNCTRSCHSTLIKESCQLSQLIKILLAAHATATSCNNLCILQLNGVAASIRNLFQNFYFILYSIHRSEGNYLTGAACIGLQSLENLGTNGTHLRTMLVANDGCINVAAQSRTSPSNKLIISNINCSAVSAQAGVQTSSNARSQIATINGSRQHQCGGLVSLYQLAYCVSI